MDAAGAFLSVNSLQRLPAGIMGVALKRARERRRSETPLQSENKQAEFSFSFLFFFLLLYLWNKRNMHLLTLGNGVSTDIKAKRCSVATGGPRSICGR